MWDNLNVVVRYYYIWVFLLHRLSPNDNPVLLPNQSINLMEEPVMLRKQQPFWEINVFHLRGLGSRIR